MVHVFMQSHAALAIPLLIQSLHTTARVTYQLQAAPCRAKKRHDTPKPIPTDRDVIVVNEEMEYVLSGG